MGERGPIPKRSTERRRRNADSAVETVQPPTSSPVDAPETPAGLHTIARAWFESLKDSGQARFYEPSDWQNAIFVAHSMTRHLKMRFSAQGFAAVWAAMNDLLTTEGSRRRVRMEVQRQAAEEDDPAVTAIADARKRLRGSR